MFPNPLSVNANYYLPNQYPYPPHASLPSSYPVIPSPYYRDGAKKTMRSTSQISDNFGSLPFAAAAPKPQCVDGGNDLSKYTSSALDSSRFSVNCHRCSTASRALRRTSSSSSTSYKLHRVHSVHFFLVGSCQKWLQKC